MTSNPTAPATPTDSSLRLGNRLAYTLREAAELIGLPGRPHVLRDAIYRRELRASTAGRRLVVLHDDLLAWLEANRR